MDDYDKAVFSIGVYATGAHEVGPVGVATFVIKESSDSTGALTALATIHATSMPGQLAASYVQNAKTIAITAVVDAAEGDIIVINGVSFVYTTVAANLLATATPGRYFGIAGGVSDGGGSAVLNSLATMLRNTTYGLPGVVSANFNFPTTSVVELSIEDTASTYFTVQTTAVPLIAPFFVYGEAHIEVHADDMTTGQSYLSAAYGTQTSAVEKQLTVVRTGRRAGGVADHHHGHFIKSS